MTNAHNRNFDRAALAGVVHAACWIVGLAVAWGVAPEAGDGDQAIVGAYTDHRARVLTEVLLVHGVAAAGPALVGVALLTWARPLRNRVGVVAGRAGIIAGLLSLAQFVVELAAIRGADARDPGNTAVLFDFVQRIDGAKMAALTVLVLAACLAARGTALLRPAETVLGYVLAVALAVSGTAYLLAADGLLFTAYVSLPLLLIWLAAAGIALRRAAGRGPGLVPGAPPEPETGQ